VVVPARGRIYVKGQPAVGAVLLLTPVGKADPEALRPKAVAGDDGVFVLGTYAKDDGAPPGDYVVTVRWRGVSQLPGEGEENNPVVGARDALLGRYSNPQTSQLRVQVAPGQAELNPLELY
jgi:hypothetical protein